MHPQQIKVMSFYLKRDGTDVRQVLNMTDDNIFWQGYDYRTGKPHDTFSCSVDYFAKWAGRELTAEERGRMQSALAIETLRTQAAERIESALKGATSEQLRAELSRRGEL